MGGAHDEAIAKPQPWISKWLADQIEDASAIQWALRWFVRT
jgi:hypothetical protein